MIDLTPLKPQLKGKPVAVFGLGKSGRAAAAACGAAGIATVLWDDNEAAREGLAGVEDLEKADFSRFSLLCLAPGVFLTHPVVKRAEAAGVEVVSDIEIFHRAHPKAKTIGITGTNGKSTTTALIGHILKTAGVESAVGGNIGEAALSLPQLSEKGIYVFELSSYQLDLCPTYAPGISILINIAPDHIDHHGSMGAYVAAKKKIFRGPGTAIVGVDDNWTQEIFSEICRSQRRGVAVSALIPLIEGISAAPEGVLKDNGRAVMDLKPCKSLQGRHNWQNAAMAYAAAVAAGVPAEKIIEGIRTFPGLAHRQNLVAMLNGIAYINDSKATNDQAAAVALAAYNPVYWIAGGKPKDGGYPDCEKRLGRVRHSFLIGEAEEKMAGWLKTQDAPFTRCGTVEKALAAAHEMAQKEKIDNAAVLFSPACASFDQFKNFEHRGDVFVSLVKALANENREACA